MAAKKEIVRRHIVFKREIDAEIGRKKKEKDRDRSWLVNHYVRLGIEAEKAAAA